VSIAMGVEERGTFLADLHVGVLAVANDDSGRPPLAIPIWYEPGGEVRIVATRDSRKAELIRRAKQLSLCVQDERLPYRYATVEGPVVAIEDPATAAERQAIAERYLGPPSVREWTRVGRPRSLARRRLACPGSSR
jgi:nitroimidazol reductase NimA-like FMN-containing flavoprotein (pyridoxamine 5'-phosphate oxidase superfamily)